MRLLNLMVLAFVGFSATAELTTYQAHTRATFVRKTESLKPGKNWLALKLELDPGWHSYWINPGDSASAPIFDFDLPEGIELEKVHYPKPKRFALGPLWSIGYEKETLYLIELRVDANLDETKAFNIGFDAEWVVCKIECVPGIFRFDMPITFSKSSEVLSKESEDIDKYIAKLPFFRYEPAKAKESDDGFILIADPKLFEDMEDIFPFHNEKVSNQPGQKISDGKYFFEKSSITTRTKDYDRFLVTYRSSTQSRVLEVTPDPQPLSLMFAFAVLGGLILNLMPCVFPVLALKVYSLAQTAQKSKRTAVGSQLVYTFGVLVSFWALAAVIVSIRAAGSNLGWGFHLQSPGFVGAMLALFVFMGLAFLDILPLGLDRVAGAGQGLTQGSGYLSSFFTGVLAVVVASPCTAPFMGVAMGYALSQGNQVVFLIFSGLGLGLAMPFLVFAIVPGLFSILPRPGGWMNVFKKAMSVPLFGTALWLAWVLSLQLGAFSPANDKYEEFTAGKVEQELEAGHPVFVNFTAAWCISCQVNEQVVFSSQAVQDFFAKQGVVQLKADWTNRDEEIGSVLSKYGRAGVPLYLFFKDKDSKPEVFPEILTESGFLSRLGKVLNNNPERKE